MLWKRLSSRVLEGSQQVAAYRHKYCWGVQQHLENKLTEAVHGGRHAAHYEGTRTGIYNHLYLLQSK